MGSCTSAWRRFWQPRRLQMYNIEQSLSSHVWFVSFANVFLTQCIHEHVCYSFNSVRPQPPDRASVLPNRSAVWQWRWPLGVKSSGCGCCTPPKVRSGSNGILRHWNWEEGHSHIQWFSCFLSESNKPTNDILWSNTRMWPNFGWEYKDKRSHVAHLSLYTSSQMF